MQKGGLPRTAARSALLALALALLAGCATGGGPSVADRTHTDRIGREVADVALSLRGSPYRYGANGPEAFDCSGLVQYAYEQAGLAVPRTARAQYDAVRRLYLHQLEPGDLVFFRTEGVTVSHVGIYLGDERFVHAPKSQSNVQVSSLDLRYWRSRLVRAGSLGR